MATPIKSTPVLKGKEARAFSVKIKENSARPVSTESFRRAEQAYKTLKANSKVWF